MGEVKESLLCITAFVTDPGQKALQHLLLTGPKAKVMRMAVHRDIEGGEDVPFAKGFYEKAIRLGGPCGFESRLVGVGRQKNEGDVLSLQLAGEIDARLRSLEENIDKNELGILGADPFVGGLYGTGEAAYHMP